MSKRVSRGSTPHRLSRSSNILPSPGIHYEIDPTRTPLDGFSSMFSELSDNVADLDSNVQQIQRVHESLTDFNESFSSFLYGLQINAYTVEFNKIPNLKNFKSDEIRERISKLEQYFEEQERGMDDTYMTNDDEGSFIAHPPYVKEKSRPVSTNKPSTATATTSTKTTASTTTKPKGSKIPVNNRRTTMGTSGGIYKSTKASEGRQRSAYKKDERPPFR